LIQHAENQKINKYLFIYLYQKKKKKKKTKGRLIKIKFFNKAMRNTRTEAGKKNKNKTNKQNKTNEQINTHICMEEVDASTPLLTDIANFSQQTKLKIKGKQKKRNNLYKLL
jgi:hypothetical protein